MCGIAAAIGSVDPGVIDAVRRTSACQRLRGPDAEGEWASGPQEARAQGGAFLAFRRLSIIDLSPEANQPMLDPETGNALVFNGEIYNFQELRRELEGLGDRFRTRSDTEVVLRAYARWGDGCLSRLRGMFGLVLWDARRRRSLVARDRMGIKPVYFAEVARPGRGRAVLIASTVRGLLAGGLIEPRLDPVGLSSYVWNGFVVGPGTIIRGIRLLPGGGALDVAADGSWREFRYWTLPGRLGATSPEEVGERLRKAVSQHLISDVPLGVFLSGGKDSSAVAALAAEASPGRVRTFTITFDEAEFDESRYARLVADALGTDHQEVRITERVFQDRLEAALAALDQPTFDAINTYLVSRAVREAGITVAMAGTGGDELFGGYRTFRDLPRAGRWSRRLGFVPGWVLRPAATLAGRVGSRSLASYPPQTRWGRVGDALLTRGRRVDLYQVAYAMFTHGVARELTRSGPEGATTVYGLPPERAAELERRADGLSELAAVSLLELELYLGERLLRDTDAASMEVSLETRVPLLDHEVVEGVFGVDDRRRFEPIGSKSLLVDVALRAVPREAFERPKRGFELPLARWCRGGLRGTVGETLRDAGRCEAAGLDAGAVARLWGAYDWGARGLYWSRVWSLFVLLWWCRRYGVSV